MSDEGPQQLLRAACRVIAVRGVEGLRTRHVAEEAGVSTALIHYHFGTRHDLVMAAFKLSDDEALATVAAARDAGAPGRTQLEQYLMAWTSNDPAIKQHWIIWTELWRWSLFEPEIRAAVTERHARFIQSIAGCIEAGVADGTIAKTICVRDATERLAACSDSFGDQVVIGIKSTDEARAALARALDNECPPPKTRSTSAARKRSPR
jgi:AcrR family transcriptional regulator